MIYERLQEQCTWSLTSSTRDPRRMKPAVPWAALGGSRTPMCAAPSLPHRKLGLPVLPIDALQWASRTDGNLKRKIKAMHVGDIVNPKSIPYRWMNPPSCEGVLCFARNVSTPFSILQSSVFYEICDKLTYPRFQFADSPLQCWIKPRLTATTLCQTLRI